MIQKRFLSKLLQENKDTYIVGSLGTISKDLEELDNGRNIIVAIKGAMGCVMGVGLGIAMNTKKKVIVVVGEGSFLMKLGSIATINKYKPKNLKVIILNNGKYASCGGQKNNYAYLFPSKLSPFDRRTYSVVKVA